MRGAVLGAKRAQEWFADVQIAAISEVPDAHTATVVGSHEVDSGMDVRSMTLRRFEEIRRRLSEGRDMFLITTTKGSP
jgi:hypothetical protein